MDCRKVRYFFEHQLLPNWYFTHKAELIGSLIYEENHLAYRVMKDLCEKEGGHMPYSPQDYQIHIHDLNERVKMVGLTMPNPEEEPQCRRVYFIFDEVFERLGYMTVELGNRFEGRGKQEADFLCGWNEEGDHLNYGICPASPEQETARLKELYLSLYEDQEKN